MLLSRDRHQTREVFFRAWAKHCENLPLEGVEPLIVAVALRHPEYHALLGDPTRAEDRDYLPETANPFLHMAMHIAIEEQLALDQPRGIRAQYQRLRARMADEHAVQHRIMECLGEWLWRAGRDGTAPSETDYLSCLARLAGGAPPG